MKRNGIEHPKTDRLAQVLGGHYEIPPELALNAAVGMLERLFHFTARYAPRGDVGQHPPRLLAERVGWAGPPELLIAQLEDAGWLERLPGGVLYVHDWHVHADNATRISLHRRGVTTFANGAPIRRWTKKQQAAALEGQLGLFDELDPAQYDDEPAPLRDLTPPRLRYDTAVDTATTESAATTPLRPRSDSPSSAPAASPEESPPSPPKGGAGERFEKPDRSRRGRRERWRFARAPERLERAQLEGIAAWAKEEAPSAAERVRPLSQACLAYYRLHPVRVDAELEAVDWAAAVQLWILTDVRKEELAARRAPPMRAAESTAESRAARQRDAIERAIADNQRSRELRAAGGALADRLAEQMRA